MPLCDRSFSCFPKEKVEYGSNDFTLALDYSLSGITIGLVSLTYKI